MAYAYNERQIEPLIANVPASKPSRLGEIFGFEELVGREVSKFKSEFPHYDRIESKKDKALALYSWILPDISDVQMQRLQPLPGNLQPGIRQPRFRYGKSYHPGTVLEEGQGNNYALSVLGCALARELGLESDIVFMQDGTGMAPGFSVKTEEGDVFLNPSKRIFRRDVKHARVDDRISYMMGLMHTRADRQEYDQALALTEKILSTKPDFNYIRLPRAEFLNALGRGDEALEEYRTVSDDEKIGFYANQMIGYQLGKMGLLPEAIQAYSKAISQQDGLSDLYLSRSILYKLLGEREKAVKDCDKAVELDDTRPVNFLHRGVLRAESGDYRASVSDFEKAITLDDRDYRSHHARGKVYEMMGDHLRASVDYSRALDLLHEIPADKRTEKESQTLFDTHIANGLCMGRRENHDSALDQFTEAIELMPENPLGYRARAAAYYSIRDYPRALSDLDKLLSLQPDNYSGMLMRGDVLFRQGESVKALEAMDQLIVKHPQAQTAYMLRSEIHSRLGNSQQAERDRRTAIELQ